MKKNITGHTKLICLLGDPVSHSISPAMHNLSFETLGLDYVYLAFKCNVEEFHNISAKDFDIVDEITLKDAFDNIPEDYRFICYLKYYYNMSGEEISRYLNISQPLVRKRCMLGMQFLRNYVNGENNE